MAQPTGAYSSYDAAGNREDLSDIIFDVSPSDTPFLSAIKKNKASGTLHEWQTDALEAAAANANIEGDDATPSAPSATTRLTNQTQILKKHAVITGTQERVDKAGRKSEMAYQVARRMKAIKLDLEFAMIDGGGALGIGNAKVAGNDTTAREMASIQTYLTSNVSVGAGVGAEATGDGTDTMTAGTLRDLTTTLLDAQLSSAFTNGGMPNILFVSPTNKGVVSGFSASGATRYVTTDDKKLTMSIDVYVGDFHTLKVVPSRQLANELALGIDPNYLAYSELRGAHSYDLAKTGDSYRKEIVMEGTLEVCNEAAHILIADTNG